MRQLLLWFGLFVAGIGPARAQCVAWPFLRIWPPFEQSTIQPRQVFRFSADPKGGSFPALRHFGRDFSAYLWNRHDSIGLRTVDSLYDGQRWFHVMLRPERPLLPDTTYQLRLLIQSPAAYNLLPLPLGRTDVLPTHYRWRVAAPDAQAPQWRGTPQVAGYHYSFNSEGQDYYVRFTTALRDDSPCLIRARVRPTAGGKAQQGYVERRADHLELGTFTCAEIFRLKPEAEYMVTFEAIDANGNRAACQPILFKAPPQLASD